MTQLEIQALLSNGVDPAIIIKSIYDATSHDSNELLMRRAQDQVDRAEFEKETNPF